MGVIADMILAVAVITLAAGAVTEFQLRVGGVGSAADGAFVGVVCFGFGVGGLIGTGGREGDDFAPGGGLSGGPSGVGPPAQRKNIDHIFSEEQEIVAQRN